MASADPTPVEIETDCAICHDLFSEPKILPCAHIMCRHCLLSWLASSKEGGCPSCRFPILAPSKKSEKPEAAVDHLPSDFAMAALVRSKRLLSQEHVCGGCGQTAVSVCLHCFDMLCASCTKIHGNLKATRQHKLSDLSTITAERLAVEQPAFCLHHSDKLAELYCPTHDKAMCHLCASMEHRTCLELKPFEQHAKLLRDKLLCTSEMLRLAEEKIDFSIKDLDQRLADAKKKAENSITEINSACDKLFRLVKACRERLNERVLKSMKGVEESVKTTRTTFLDQRRRINSHRRIVNRLQDTCPCDELDKATVIAEDCLRELDMNTVLDSSIILMATFSIGSITLMKLEKELSFLGEERFVDILSEARFWKFGPQTNAQFTNNGLTVEKVGGTSIIMVSTSPMKTNNLYEVRIDKVKEGSKDFFPCGVLFSQSQPLAETYLRGQEGAIVFSSDIFVHGKVKGSSSLERKLKGLKEGTRVGFVRDLGGFLHLYIDGEKQWVYVRKVFNPCYVFFELFHVYQKAYVVLVLNSVAEPPLRWTHFLDTRADLSVERAISEMVLPRYLKSWAFERNCPKWKLEQEIQKVKAELRCTFVEAKKFMTECAKATTYASVSCPKTESISTQTDLVWVKGEHPEVRRSSRRTSDTVSQKAPQLSASVGTQAKPSTPKPQVPPKVSVKILK